MLYTVPLFFSLFQCCWRILYHWPVHCFSALHCSIIVLMIFSVLLKNIVCYHSVHCFSVIAEHFVLLSYSLFRCFTLYLCSVHCFSAIGEHCVIGLFIVSVLYTVVCIIALFIVSVLLKGTHYCHSVNFFGVFIGEHSLSLSCSLFKCLTLRHCFVHCFSAIEEHNHCSVHCFSTIREHCVIVCSLFQYFTL